MELVRLFCRFWVLEAFPLITVIGCLAVLVRYSVSKIAVVVFKSLRAGVDLDCILQDIIHPVNL